MLSDGTKPPYGNLTPAQIMEVILNGTRLPCPEGNSAAMKDIYKVITRRCWNDSPNERMAAAELWGVVASRMNSHNEDTKQAALSQGLYLPDGEDFQYLRSRHLMKGKVPKHIMKRHASQGFSYLYKPV